MLSFYLLSLERQAPGPSCFGRGAHKALIEAMLATSSEWLSLVPRCAQRSFGHDTPGEGKTVKNARAEKILHTLRRFFTPCASMHVEVVYLSMPAMATPLGALVVIVDFDALPSVERSRHRFSNRRPNRALR